MNDKDFNSDIASENYTELMTRLGQKYSPAKSISGYIQRKRLRQWEMMNQKMRFGVKIFGAV